MKKKRIFYTYLISSFTEINELAWTNFAAYSERFINERTVRKGLQSSKLRF